MVDRASLAAECTSGPPVQVGYSDTARATGVGGRAAAPYMRVGTRSGAFNGRRSAGGTQVDDTAVTSA